MMLLVAMARSNVAAAQQHASGWNSAAGSFARKSAIRLPPSKLQFHNRRLGAARLRNCALNWATWASAIHLTLTRSGESRAVPVLPTFPLGTEFRCNGQSINGSPTPPAWCTIGPRSSLLAEKTSKNRNATHPINAMLNYAYAVLLGQLKIQLVSEGYDPTIGIMHHDYRGGPAFVLDHMEPLRPVVDREVIQFALANELQPADFVLRSDGGVGLIRSSRGVSLHWHRTFVVNRRFVRRH